MRKILFIFIILTPLFSLAQYGKLIPEQGAGYSRTAGTFSGALGLPRTNGLPAKSSVKYLLPKGWDQLGVDTSGGGGKLWLYNHVSDSVYYYASGGGSGGNPNTNLANGFRIAKSGTNQLYTLYPRPDFQIDSTTNPNGITIGAIPGYYETRPGTTIAGSRSYRNADNTTSDKLVTKQEVLDNDPSYRSNGWVSSEGADGIGGHDSATGTLSWYIGNNSVSLNNRGFRNNANTLQYQDASGTWQNIGSGGGGGSTTPAGNTGDIQINRNGVFSTPASDSLSFNGGILTSKGNVSGKGFYLGSSFALGTDGTNIFAQAPLNGGGSFIVNNSFGNAQNIVGTDAGNLTVRNNFTANGTVTGAYLLANAATAPYFGTPGAVFTRSASNTLMLGNAQSDRSGTLLAGVGNFNGTNPLYLSGVQATATLSSDSVITINAGVIKKAPFSSFASANIYNSDGSLTGDRTVDLNGHTLKFATGGAYAQLGNDGTFQYYNNDPYVSFDGTGRRFQVGDYTNDWYGTFMDVNDDVGSKQIALHATGGVVINNLAGQGIGLVGVDNDGLMSWKPEAIPLTGTVTPVTGDIGVQDNIKIGNEQTWIHFETPTLALNSVANNEDGNPELTSLNINGGGSNGGGVVISASPNSKGLSGTQDFTPNITDLDYPQETYVIPRAGTKPGKDITGSLKFAFNIGLQMYGGEYGDYLDVKLIDAGTLGSDFFGLSTPDGNNWGGVGNAGVAFKQADNYYQIQTGESSEDGIKAITVALTNNVNLNEPFAGLRGASYYGDYYTDNTYVQKKYVDAATAFQSIVAKLSMTESQRLALSSPYVGELVYQTDGTEGYWVYKSTGWAFGF